MISDDQDIYDFPPWIWPYIRWARLGREAVSQAAGPLPDPWRFIGNVVSILGVKAAARSLRDDAARKRLGQSLDIKLNILADDYCGTVPRPWPHPWPGPHPHVYTTAAQLALVAHSLQPGEMRDDLQNVAGDLLRRAGELEQRAG
ncbi:MAG: hypothetical protein IPK78_13745 [Rhodospirillales bacterium]|nr:hypothetical protein [Rhodospirillales bacterium]